MELIHTYEHGDLGVKIYYNGTDKMPNKVFLKGKLVYEDDTYRPSPLYEGIDDPGVMVALLGFYALRKGDVEEDFFKARDCPEVLEWAENDEEVRLMINDYEMRDDEGFLRDNEMTREECSRIEKFIITNH